MHGMNTNTLQQVFQKRV